MDVSSELNNQPEDSVKEKVPQLENQTSADPPKKRRPGKQPGAQGFWRTKPLIRKAIALTGAVNRKAAQIGKWILDSLKELIAAIAKGEDKSSNWTKN